MRKHDSQKRKLKAMSTLCVAVLLVSTGFVAATRWEHCIKINIIINNAEKYYIKLKSYSIPVLSVLQIHNNIK